MRYNMRNEYRWVNDNLFRNGILVGGVRSHSENTWYWITLGVYMLGIPDNDTYDTPVDSIHKAKIRCSKYVKECIERSAKRNASSRC